MREDKTRCQKCHVQGERHAFCADCGDPVCHNQDECKCGRAILFGAAILAWIGLLIFIPFLR